MSILTTGEIMAVFLIIVFGFVIIKFLRAILRELAPEPVRVREPVIWPRTQAEINISKAYGYFIMWATPSALCLVASMVYVHTQYCIINIIAAIIFFVVAIFQFAKALGTKDPNTEIQKDRIEPTF